MVTGDLTLSGESREFERAADLLRWWSAAGKLTVVPGNHDVWTADAVDTGRLQTLGLFLVEQAQAAADVQAVLVLDLRDGAGDVVDLAVAGAAAGGDDAIGAGLRRHGPFGTLHQLGFVQQRVPRDLGLGNDRLRTVSAIFRTETALGVLQEVQMDLPTKVPPPDAVGRGEQIEQVIVVRPEDRQTFVGRQFVSCQDSIGQLLPIGRTVRQTIRVVHQQSSPAMFRGSHSRPPIAAGGRV